MRSLNLLTPPFAMSTKIKTIAMPISERQNKSKAICNLRKYVIQKYCELRHRKCTECSSWRKPPFGVFIRNDNL